MTTDRHVDLWLERACQLAAVGLSVSFACLLRFDFSIPAGFAPTLRQAVLLAALAKLPIFDWVGFYRGLRPFVGIPDLYTVFLGNFAGSLVFALAAILWIGPEMTLSVLLIDFLLCFLSTALVRFSTRIHHEGSDQDRSGKERKGILVYGAGSAGAALVREIRSNPCTQYDVLGFLDDDPLKQGTSITGIPVLGSG